MLVGNPSRPGGRKLRPYEPPAFTQMTPQSALLALKGNTRPWDAQAQRMLAAIEGEKILGFAKDRPARTRFSKPRVSTVRRMTFLAVFSSLCAMPVLLLLASLSNDSVPGRPILHLAVFWLPLWAVFALWVTLDTAVFYSLVGSRPDPLGSKGLKLSALGLANMTSALVFLARAK